jgi:hypothetical protein
MERLKPQQRKARVEADVRDTAQELQARARQIEWGSRLDFEVVAPGIAKLKGRNVFAYDDCKHPSETCNVCWGKGKVGRRKCLACGGEGECWVIENYFRRNSISFRVPLELHVSVCLDLDESRTCLMSDRAFLEDARTEVWTFLVDDLAPLENILHFEPA